MRDTDADGEFDVIVVGAGASGGVIAARLSENPALRVALIEAGPDFPNESWDPPGFLSGGGVVGEGFAGAAAPLPQVDWNIWSEAVSGDRRVHLHRGRMVGGSSMINGCIAVRGKSSDFERWEREGAVGWGWDDVVPFYERVERTVPIRRYPKDAWLPAQRTFAAGFAELGFDEVEDLNSPTAWDGVVGPWPQNRRNEVRLGTLVTYLREARPRENLTILAERPVQRVLFDGTRAVGVVCEEGDGMREYRARTVVVSAGSYGSPALLQRSGIGSRAVIAALGIPQLVELPAGDTLRDHPQCVFMVRCDPEHARIAGPGYSVAARGQDFWSFPLPLDEEEGVVGLAFGSTDQFAVGSVRAESMRADAPPRVEHNYRLAIERGLFEGAWETFRALATTSAFAEAGYHGGDLDRSLTEVLHERLGTAYHPCGSCAIGDVVDERLRVRGVDGLMVADASVFPSNMENNPHLTCLMIGERAADFLLSEVASNGDHGA